MIIIRNARLIPELTEGYTETLADVVVDGNRIESIHACGVEVSNPQVEIIDAQGKTLMPGLWDLHAHLYLQSQTCNTDVLMQDLGEELFDCYRYSREYLKQGYTSIRDVGGTQETALYVRDAIKRGDLKGSRVLASGLIITPTETGNKTFPLLYAVADSPDELRKVARLELEKGADFLKYMGTGAFTNKDGNPDNRIATDAELKAIQEVAEMKHTYVAVHAHGAEAIDRCVEFGIRTIEHGSFVSDWAIERLLKNETSYIIPTSSFWATFLDAGAQGLVANAGSKRELVFKSFERWRIANEAGLKLGWGTDITQPEFVATPGLEFITRRDHCGFSNMDMLLQATKNSAEIAGFGDSLGTVKEGKIADLIIVDGNPDEDIDVMTRLPLCVIRDGERLI